MRRYIPPARPAHADPRTHYFALLTAEEQRSAIQKLIASGCTEEAAAALSGLGIRDLRRLLGTAAS
jgi:hypothetical protein